VESTGINRFIKVLPRSIQYPQSGKLATSQQFIHYLKLFLDLPANQLRPGTGPSSAAVVKSVFHNRSFYSLEDLHFVSMRASSKVGSETGMN
jgi:hypothetical protein